MPEALIMPTLILARILMGALFVIGGMQHFTKLDPIAGVIAARGVPQPRLVLIAGSIFQIVLGATLALGFFIAPSALGLVLFTVAATVMLVNFWDKAEPERTGLFNVFLSNLAIIGGLLALAASA